MKASFKFSIYFFLIIFIFSVSCNTSTKKASAKPIRNNSVKFINNESSTLTDVLAKAKAQNKFVFIDFYASWCLPCNMLDEEVFNQNQVFEFMNSNFINYKVDVERANGPNLRLLFEAKELPTLLFLNGDGRVVEKQTKSITQTELIALGKKVLQNHTF